MKLEPKRTDTGERSARAHELICRARNRIIEAKQRYEPDAMFAMFSGGHDSLTATGIANLVSNLTASVHINTGIGVEETREFVRATCAEQNWRLLEYKAMKNCQADGTPDPQDYRQIVRKHGFPGPAGHNMMYARLKQRQIQRLCRDFKKKRMGRILLIAGCRSEESVRRMRTTKPLAPEAGTCRVWCNPIHDFTKADCHCVMESEGWRRSPVVDLIHKSGECLCGAFAEKGELAELALWFPAVAAELRALEAEVREKFGWGWEGRPPTRRAKLRITGGQIEMPLCHNCLIKTPA